jgi:preprotein translocase subunit SecG
VFGLTGAGTSLSTLTIVLGATIFLLISLGLHLMARHLLKGLVK